ncbi:MAG: hypothetical protein ACRENP_07330 [Longimicrobiales bacterium]
MRWFSCTCSAGGEDEPGLIKTAHSLGDSKNTHGGEETWPLTAPGRAAAPANNKEIVKPLRFLPQTTLILISLLIFAVPHLRLLRVASVNQGSSAHISAGV